MNRRPLRVALVALALVALVDRAIVAVMPSWAWMDCFDMTSDTAPCVRPRPRCRATFTGFLRRSRASADFSLTADGHRAPERAPTPPRGALRVAVFGASNVFGLGVRDGEDWPSRVEPELSRALGGRPVEVVNHALPGHDLAQQVAHATVVASREGAHHAVLVAGADELEPTECPVWRSLFERPGARSGLVRAWRVARAPLRSRDPEAARERGIRAAIEARRARPDVRMTLLATGALGETGAVHTRRVEALRRADIAVIDAQDALRGVLDQGDRSLWDEGGEQLNARGHRAVAERVAGRLAEALSTP